MAKEKKLVIDQAKKIKKFVPLSTEYLLKHEVLTKFKIDVINHPAKRKIAVGAKGNGKTLMAKLDELIFMENNPMGSTFDFRKYADMASEKLGDYFSYAINMVKHTGYEFRPKYGYEKRRNRFYAKKSYNDMSANSYQQYASLDNLSSIDGSAPANGGFYGRKHIDEPIVKEDMLDREKIPTKESWEATESLIKDNLERFNKPFEKRVGKKVPDLISWYTMNDWGQHPLSVETQGIFPRERFIKLITGYELNHLLGNKELITRLCKYDEDLGQTILDSEWGKMWLKKTGGAIYNKNNDTLYIRMTKFENPFEAEGENAINNLKQIANGFIYKNYRKLAQFAGLQFEPELDYDMLVYNIRNFNNSTPEKLFKEGYVAEKIIYGIDIDSSRIFTIAPIILLKKVNRTLLGGFKTTYKVFIDKIIELPANGTGEFGEMIELQSKHIAALTRKHFEKLFKNEKVRDFLKSTHMVVDDTRKEYLKHLKDFSSSFIEYFTKPIKKGHYDIVERQDYMENGFKNGIIMNHEKNKLLEEDIKRCVKADITKPQRKTIGSTNYLDRIDPVEYGIYPLIGYLLKPERTR